jgi:hypothetical protein
VLSGASLSRPGLEQYGCNSSDLDDARAARSDALAQRDDAVLSQEIDAIIARLGDGTSKLCSRMDETLASPRRPIAL